MGTCISLSTPGSSTVSCTSGAISSHCCARIACFLSCGVARRCKLRVHLRKYSFTFTLKLHSSSFFLRVSTQVAGIGWRLLSGSRMENMDIQQLSNRYSWQYMHRHFITRRRRLKKCLQRSYQHSDLELNECFFVSSLCWYGTSGNIYKWTKWTSEPVLIITCHGNRLPVSPYIDAVKYLFGHSFGASCAGLASPETCQITLPLRFFLLLGDVLSTHLRRWSHGTKHLKNVHDYMIIFVSWTLLRYSSNVIKHI